MKNSIKIILSAIVLTAVVSCKDGNSNEGSQSYIDNHPQDSLQKPKGDSARVANDTFVENPE